MLVKQLLLVPLLHPGAIVAPTPLLSVVLALQAGKRDLQGGQFKANLLQQEEGSHEARNRLV